MKRSTIAALLAVSLATAGGCADTDDVKKERPVTKQVGSFPPSPNADKIEVGIAPFKVTDGEVHAQSDAADLAADELASLASLTGRFRVVERGFLDPDYTFRGRITRLRVPSEPTSPAAEAECGLDLKLVDNTTGDVVAGHFAEIKRTYPTTADSESQMLRIAIDEALRKMLPEVDQAVAMEDLKAPARKRVKIEQKVESLMPDDGTAPVTTPDDQDPLGE